MTSLLVGLATTADAVAPPPASAAAADSMIVSELLREAVGLSAGGERRFCLLLLSDLGVVVGDVELLLCPDDCADR